ncbi:hypothetical protein PQX77_019191 [Marasmius sp. AFHP31]|nr:hypothetical protein PQX77_019191 [Marasmius sp. AFHP31]
MLRPISAPMLHLAVDGGVETEESDAWMDEACFLEFHSPVGVRTEGEPRQTISKDNLSPMTLENRGSGEEWTRALATDNSQSLTSTTTVNSDHSSLTQRHAWPTDLALTHALIGVTTPRYWLVSDRLRGAQAKPPSRSTSWYHVLRSHESELENASIQVNNIDDISTQGDVHYGSLISLQDTE